MLLGRLTARALIERGADLNLVNNGFTSPAGVRVGKDEVAFILLKAGGTAV